MQTRIERLRVLRDSLEGAMADGIGARDLASVSREYRATLAEIAEIESADVKMGDGIDEIAERRSARRTGASSGASRARHA